MKNPENSDQAQGKRIRLTWTQGPTKGTTQEHVFHHDGTVEWHSVGESKKAESTAEEAKKPASKPERPEYVAFALSNDACMVSYLSKSGYTLTVVLGFKDSSVVGVASNDKSWYPVRGTLQVVG